MGGKAVDIEEKLPWYRAFPLGLQHFLSMFGATVLVPTLMGFSPSVSVMCSGIGTALYLLATKGKIPSYLGPSFSFVGPVVRAATVAGAAGVGSAIVVAGLVFIGCALVVRAVGTAWIERFIPTIVMSEIVFVIGAGLATTAVSEALTAPDGASLWQVLVVDFTPVLEAPWVDLPDVTLPTFDLSAIILVSPIALIVVIEHIGHLFVIGEMTHRDFNPLLWRSLLGDGLATTVAGFLGAPPATTFAENIGVLNVTRVYATQVFWYAAATTFIVGGFCPKLGALVGTIPDAVIGGVSVVIFGLIACNALKMLVEHEVDMTSSRNLIIFGGPAIAAIGMQSLGVGIPVGDYAIPGLAVAALLGIELNVVLPGRPCATVAASAGTGETDARPLPDRDARESGGDEAAS